MSAAQDGGPAFPHPERVEYSGAQPIMENFAPGMSLRDHFAGQIIAGMNAVLVRAADWPTAANMQTMAESAYAQADAMLAARAKATRA